MRVLLVVALVGLAACGSGDADDTTTTVVTTVGTTGGSTTSAATTATTGATTSTGSGTPATTTIPEGPDLDCADLWPLDVVQDVVGDDIEFVAANEDGSACTYLGDGGGVAVAWREGDQVSFDLARQGAEAAGNVDGVDTSELAACDEGFAVEAPGLLIVEVYDAADGLIYNVTLSGDVADVATAVTLVTSAC